MNEFEGSGSREVRINLKVEVSVVSGLSTEEMAGANTWFLRLICTRPRPRHEGIATVAAF